MKVLIAAALIALSGCAASPDRDPKTQLRVWIAADANMGAVGRNPLANVLLTQPITPYLEAHYLHVSSLVEKNDPGTIDSVGVGVCVSFPIRPCE